MMKNLQTQTTILLIENDSDWLVDVYSVLQEAGYDVLIATGGDEGFCVARRVRPNLILCDAALTDISGVQLCYMIRADKNLHQSSFVLMGEGDQDCEIAVEAFGAGADEYFEKNCNRQFLRAKIARLLELQNVEVELRQRCENLSRSEKHLTKIIEDVSNLIHSFDEKGNLKSKGFFSTGVEPKKKADTSGTWKQALQPKEPVAMSRFSSEKREKVYYEIVC